MRPADGVQARGGNSRRDASTRVVPGLQTARRFYGEGKDMNTKTRRVEDLEPGDRLLIGGLVCQVEKVDLWPDRVYAKSLPDVRFSEGSPVRHMECRRGTTFDLVTPQVTPLVRRKLRGFHGGAA